MAKRGKVAKVQPRDVIERPARFRRYKYLMLIVCEDQNTECAYFDQFRGLFNSLLPNDTVFVKAVGTGRNSLGVVLQAIAERDKLVKVSGKKVDDVWAVFDKDDLDKMPKTRKNFEQAFVKADEENIKIAYSNECFELWLLLHFINVSPTEAIPRSNLYEKLEKAVAKHNPQFVYHHGDAAVLGEVAKHGNEKQAIERAKALNHFHEQNQHTPIDSNPRTLVFSLVEQLREWYDFYSYE